VLFLVLELRSARGGLGMDMDILLNGEMILL
jgi:hypothetical protein